jgi:quercetin dioxygenase-like cupin family protein
MFHHRKWQIASRGRIVAATRVAALGAVVGFALAGAPVLATTGSGFTPSNIVNGQFGTLDVKTAGEKTDKWGMLLKTKDDTDVGSDRLTIDPGGYSGWHAHPAPVFITVTSGSIIWYNGSNPLCTPHTYNTGDSFIEDAYVIHNVLNASSSASAEFIAIRINPTGVMFRLDRPEPNNCTL